MCGKCALFYGTKLPVTRYQLSTQANLISRMLYNSSSSVSSSSTSGEGCFSGFFPRVAGRPKGRSRFGGGRPSLGDSSCDAFPTDFALNVSDDFARIVGATLSSSVSSSDGSGVAAGASSLSCSPSLAWSISI